MNRLVRAFALLLACVAGSALAATTPVRPLGAGTGSERCIGGAACAAGGAYGGAASIAAIFEADLGLAPGSLQRVDDALDGRWSAISGDAAVRPFARYAGDTAVLGVSAPRSVLEVSPALANGRVYVDHPGRFASDPRAGDIVANPHGWTSIPSGADDPFAFVLRNRSASLNLASDTTLARYSNSGYAQDWMVTWRVPGPGHLYLVAWEDRIAIGANGRPNDWDYNDYVFVVRDAAPFALVENDAPLPPVPLPAGLVLFLSGAAFACRFVRRLPAAPGGGASRPRPCRGSRHDEHRLRCEPFRTRTLANGRHIGGLACARCFEGMAASPSSHR